MSEPASTPRRSIYSWYLLSTTAALTLLTGLAVVINVVSRMSPVKALEIASLPVFGEAALAISATLPASLEILPFALMIISTLGIYAGANTKGATGAVVLGLVGWDAFAIVLSLFSLALDIDEFDVLRRALTAPTLALVLGLSGSRVLAMVLGIRSGYLPKLSDD